MAKPGRPSQEHKWDDAIAMLINGDLSYTAICAKLGINTGTLHTWMTVNQNFRDKYDEALERFKAEALACGIANKENRLALLRDRHAALMKIVRDRQASDEFEDVPGGDTGYIAKLPPKEYKSGEVVQVFELDKTLLDALLDIEQRAREEMGQVEEKVVTENSTTVRLEVDLTQCTDEQINVLEQLKQRVLEQNQNNGNGFRHSVQNLAGSN